MLCHRLPEGMSVEAKRNAVIVLGAAQCSSGFGYFPGPMKKLRRYLEEEYPGRVVVLDEHYTSKRCSKCAFSSDVEVEEVYKDLEPGKSVRSSFQGES